MTLGILYDLISSVGDGGSGLFQCFGLADIVTGTTDPSGFAHLRCLHVETAMACNRRDWMDAYTANVFYVALACKLTHQFLAACI